ncbi:hypothetical protein BJ508DRAFT_308380 [Ascobolus immersus RN42]|uniref:Uncharacterized protein n=1 Tax=Ascobolus immersus RN42 TaxID=1160509 RepID=A0A3N4I027_ASCIM|nr:hypothetical protein BJ508DRAFT_308380 [Ascobolus immersus RN42]
MPAFTNGQSAIDSISSAVEASNRVSTALLTFFSPLDALDMTNMYTKLIVECLQTLDMALSAIPGPPSAPSTGIRYPSNGAQPSYPGDTNMLYALGPDPIYSSSYNGSVGALSSDSTLVASNESNSAYIQPTSYAEIEGSIPENLLNPLWEMQGQFADAHYGVQIEQPDPIANDLATAHVGAWYAEEDPNAPNLSPFPFDLFGADFEHGADASNTNGGLGAWMEVDGEYQVGSTFYNLPAPIARE